MNPPVLSTLVAGAASAVFAVTGAPLPVSPAASPAPSSSAAAAPAAAPERGTGPAAAAAAPPEGAVVHSTGDGGGPADVLAYWTPERMAEATPLDLATGLTGGATDTVRGLLDSEREQQAEGADASRVREQTDGSIWPGGGRVTRTVGRVFLTIAGRDFVCSAAVVDAANRDTVITAGHCLKNGRGAWADNWTFVPGYTDGREPYGSYVARDMAVPRGWAEQADDDYDFGFAVLHRSGRRHVADRVGSHPLAFERPAGDQVYAFGYPSRRPYSGDDLVYCAGRSFRDTAGTSDYGMGCAMTSGSSGGPWFADFDPASGEGVIMSVVSFKYSDDPRTQYGPFLGPEARELHAYAARL
ncbi:trypsin-like peptidase domain-containing protein [Allonocardiopsis opalescens]|uniref:Trypsin-like peptidase n=1 Tax=Allonocardiopsis opalescens TaxID=1144618 RepID=A0A2T0PVF9_9ACTN|nr:trypsin-like peptidase domain-containing protein [Allonocardiopsis opalescens]PRX95526.1 trypsin-like peptidase [Allonocardiopsis opalescens]